MRLQDLAGSIQARRKALGMTQWQLAHLAEVSRPTVIGLERGTLNDLGFQRLGRILTTLGLAFNTQYRPRGRALWAAAKSASVSFRTELSPDSLGDMLASGVVSTEFRPHVAHLLNEVPAELVVRAVEEAAARAHVKPRVIWKNVAQLAKDLHSSRARLWL